MITYYELLISKIYNDASDILQRLGAISKEEEKEEILDLVDALTSDIFYFCDKVSDLRKLLKEGD